MRVKEEEDREKSRWSANDKIIIGNGYVGMRSSHNGAIIAMDLLGFFFFLKQFRKKENQQINSKKKGRVADFIIIKV